MKIVHLIYSFNTGGSETMLVDIANEQAKQAEVNIIIINRIYSETLLNKIDKQVKIYLINRVESSKNPYPAIKLNVLLMRLNAKVLHCHNHNIIPLLFPFYRKKTVLTIHEIGVDIKYLRSFSKLFAISKTVKEDLFSRGGLIATIVYNGISTKKIQAKEDISTNSIFKIILIGRLDHQNKGQHIAFESIKILKDRSIKNIQLDLIGSGKSYEFLIKLKNKYGLTEQINFLGLKDREYLYSHIKDYDLLIQPSINEGFGLTVAEGMAAKIPVLVSDINGPMEIIENGKYGFHFKAGSAESLAYNIQSIMSNFNSEPMQKQTEAAYIHVKGNFDIKTCVKTYFENY